MSGSALQRPVIAQALRAAGHFRQRSRPKEFASTSAAATRIGPRARFPACSATWWRGASPTASRSGCGTNCVVDAACASSLAAVQMAMQELWCGVADMVITGGVDALNDIFMFMCFSKTQAHVQILATAAPFAADADGTMLGEGIGMFALRGGLLDAERDGDRIYAVLRGMEHFVGRPRQKHLRAPTPKDRRVPCAGRIAAADYGPETVGLLEAHGTGTMAGDAAEFAALREVFLMANPANLQCCALAGSVKSQIGHTKAAAGSASLYKAVMALHHKGPAADHQGNYTQSDTAV